MRSIKTKLFSLALAACMVLALAGCSMSTPSTVGTIGGVEIPRGHLSAGPVQFLQHRRQRG